MDSFLWLFLPAFVAGGSALLSYFLMQAKMDVALAKERESLAEARAVIDANKATLEQRVKAVQEETRRTTMDEIMRDFRLEERSYMRDSSAGGSSKKMMVMQERMFFRNIPLSNWTEREMLLEEEAHAALNGGAEQGQMPVMFPAPVQAPDGRIAISKQIAGQTVGPVAGSNGGPYAMPKPQDLAALHAATGQSVAAKGLQVIKRKSAAAGQVSSQNAGTRKAETLKAETIEKLEKKASPAAVAFGAQ